MGHVIIAVALSAFWGLARLGELLNNETTTNSVKVRDLEWAPHCWFAKIAIRNAKTAEPGEIRLIHLQSQASLLDPLGAIDRLLERNNSINTDPLFSYLQNGNKVVLTKKLFLAWVLSVVGPPDSAMPCPKGHSFRIDGASLMWNFQVPTDRMKDAGRWKSNTYRRYIRCYSEVEMATTKQVLAVMRVE